MATRFKKAVLAQAKLRLALYGPPGSGKTFSSLLIAEGIAKKEGRRIAFVDTEVSGSDFYSKATSRPVHPEPFDFDMVKTQSIAVAFDALRSLKPSEHSVVVIDSISHIWEACMNAADVERNRKGLPKFAEWARIKKPFKDFVKWLLECPFHVIICGRQKNEFDNDSETGELQKTGVTMNAERDTAYEPQVCIRLYAKAKKDDTTQSVYHAFVEKDRTGMLAGRTLANLSYKHFEPVVALLGGEQVAMESTDDAALRDAELFAKNDVEAEEKRSAKSLEIVSHYAPLIAAARTVDDLRAIAEELKVKRGQLSDENYEALIGAYTKKSKEVRDGAV